MQMLEEEARESGGSASSSRLLSITRSEIRRLENLAGDFLSYARLVKCPCCESGEGGEASLTEDGFIDHEAHYQRLMSAVLATFAFTVFFMTMLFILLGALARAF